MKTNPKLSLKKSTVSIFNILPQKNFFRLGKGQDTAGTVQDTRDSSSCY